jgi:hypothetical protein
VSDPILQLKALLQNRPQNIHNTEMTANINLDISCIFVFWQHEPSFSFDQKEDICDIISFEINVLVFWSLVGLQQWTNPSNDNNFIYYAFHFMKIGSAFL